MVIFSPPGSQPAHGLTYVIIGARYQDKWIFVFHNRRRSYGMPAGHIDHGEDSCSAAERELREETGALKFTLERVAVYTVESGDKAGSGVLFFAEVDALGEILDKEEIGNIFLSDKLPDDSAFSEIQVILFNYLVKYTNARGG
jgi:8-oxo-dGTP diphosphatase